MKLKPSTAHPNIADFPILSLCLFLLLPLQLRADDYLQWQDIIGRSFKAKIVDVAAQSVRLENPKGKQIDFAHRLRARW